MTQFAGDFPNRGPGGIGFKRVTLIGRMTGSLSITAFAAIAGAVLAFVLYSAVLLAVMGYRAFVLGLPFGLAVPWQVWSTLLFVCTVFSAASAYVTAKIGRAHV